MKQIAQINPSQSVQTQQSRKVLQQAEQDAQATTIAAAVRQSYDIFQTYGRTPEQLKTYVVAFDVALEKYSTAQINQAFGEYLRIGKVMPTPAHIVEIIEANKPPRTPKYDNGTAEEHERIRQSRKQLKVTWAYKVWNEMDSREKGEVIQRLREEQEKKSDQWKYFRDNKGVPADIIERCSA